jgi:hypothetical protein
MILVLIDLLGSIQVPVSNARLAFHAYCGISHLVYAAVRGSVSERK